jgi:CHAT domain-containing protein/tetratricopeptide (TPR) repeat protein
MKRTQGSIIAAFFLLLPVISQPMIGAPVQQAAPAVKPQQPVSQAEQQITSLRMGEPIEREMKRGEVHAYHIKLTAGQLLHATVDQRGIDVSVLLLAPDGKQVGYVNSPGLGHVWAIAENSGSYRIEVLSLRKKTDPGRYEIRIEELHKASQQDKARVAGERAFVEAGLLRAQGDVPSLRKAIAKYEESLQMRQVTGDRRGQATALLRIGYVYHTLGEFEKALDSFAQALPIFQEVADRSNEAATLNNIAFVHRTLGEKQTAIDYYKQALSIYVAAKDRSGEATVIENIGGLYSSLDEKQKAIEYYTQARELRKATGDQLEEAAVLNKIGSIYVSLDDHKKALEYYAQARDISTSIDDLAGIGVSLKNIAILLDFAGDRQKALEYLHHALAVNRGTKDRMGEADTLNKIAKVFDSLGERRKAIDHYNQSLQLSITIGDHLVEAFTLTSIGLVYDSLGEKQKAIEYHTQALPISRAARSPSYEASIFNNLGLVYESLGQNQKALEYYSQALTIFRTIGNRSGEASTLNNIGKLQDSQGERELALDYYMQSLALLQAIANHSGKARVLNNIGLNCSSLGEKQIALKFFQQALRFSKIIGDRTGEVSALSNSGKVFSSIDQKDRALNYYQQALNISRAQHYPLGEAVTLNDIGLFYNDLGEAQRALEYYLQALSICRAIEDRKEETSTLRNIGGAYDNLGEKQKALEYYNQALPISQAIGDRSGEANTLHKIGAVYADLGEKQKALEYYNQALTIRRAVSDRFGESATLNNMGVVYEALNDQTKAIDSYIEAVARLEGLRTFATIDEIQTGISDPSIPVYQRAILLLAQLGRQTEAFYLTEQARARVFLNQIGNIRPRQLNTPDAQLIADEQALMSEIRSIEQRLRKAPASPAAVAPSDELLPLESQLESQLAVKRRQYGALLLDIKLTNPEYAPLRNVNTLTLAEIQRTLDKDTTLISYFVTDKKTLGFVITSSSFQAVEVPVEEAKLVNLVRWFRAFASLRDPQLENLRQLYGWLIAPLKKYIKTPKVGIIPHGILNYLPFAALTDGKSFFGNEHTLFYLPSASVLPFIRGKSEPAGAQMLALAQSHAEGVSGLQHADEEARAIADLFSTEALTGINASISEFRKRAAEYSILHIAAHAEMNAVSPLFSRIMLAPGKDDTGALEVRDVYDLDLSKASLVVLSACETQLGKRSQGDDISALNRAFIYAGAPTVIASLWIVDDKSTSYLMRAFYTHLKRGMSKAEALRAAQSDTRKKYPDPYYWAAFVLTGDPGPIRSATKSPKG